MLSILGAMIAASDSDPISYLASDTVSFGSTSGSLTLSSIDDDLVAGDLLLLAVSAIRQFDTDISATGFTELADVYVNGAARDAHLYVGYKISDGTETSVSISAPNSNSIVAVCLSFRNANYSSVVTDTTINTFVSNPPETAESCGYGDYVVAVYASASATGSIFSHTAGEDDNGNATYIGNRGFTVSKVGDTAHLSMQYLRVDNPGKVNPSAEGIPTETDSTDYSSAGATVRLTRVG